MVVFGDGKLGLNCEHSWADAPVAAHMLETAMVLGESRLSAYLDDGHVRPFEPEPGCGREPPAETWARLPWVLSRDGEAAVLASHRVLRSLGDDLHLRVSSYSAYGKDFIKQCHVSP